MGPTTDQVVRELGNLLTIVRECVEKLTRQLEAGDPAVDDLASLDRAARRAAALVRNLEAAGGQPTEDGQILDLNWVVASTDRMLRRLVGDAIRISLTLDPTIGEICFDRTQVEELLMNLVAHARETMPEGGTVKIATAAAPDPPRASPWSSCDAAGYVLLAVSHSNVVGGRLQGRLSPAMLALLDDEPARFGLSTVHRIVTEHGGDMEIDAEPGRGTTFRLFLPRANRHPAPADQSPAASAQATLLVVEDEPAIRRLVTTLLRRQGYRVLAAPDADHALALAADLSMQIDLLITDIVMPGLTGTELAERLRQLRPGLRTLFISGYPNHALVGNYMLGPEMRFLHKPFTPASLARTVREALNPPAPTARVP